MSDDNDLMMSRAIGDICTERSLQVSKDNKSRKHDDTRNGNGELASAAAMYAFASTMSTPSETYAKIANTDMDGPGILLFNILRHLWPRQWRPPNWRDRRGHLVVAGALIVAEIERIDREAAQRAAHLKMINENRRPLPGDNPVDPLGLLRTAAGEGVPMKHGLD